MSPAYTAAFANWIIGARPIALQERQPAAPEYRRSAADPQRSVPTNRSLSVTAHGASSWAASGILAAAHAERRPRRRKIEQPGRTRCSRGLAEASSCSSAAGWSYSEVANTSRNWSVDGGRAIGRDRYQVRDVHHAQTRRPDPGSHEAREPTGPAKAVGLRALSGQARLDTTSRYPSGSAIVTPHCYASLTVNTERHSR